jgi:hypothetical protein
MNFDIKVKKRSLFLVISIAFTPVIFASKLNEKILPYTHHDANITLKSVVFCVVTPCSSDRANRVHQKQTGSLLLLISSLAYYSTLKMEAV